MNNYRSKFSDQEEARKYDALFVDEKRAGYSHSVLWDYEKHLLDRIVAELRTTHARIDYLDFASGTGRILIHLEDKVDTSTGVEISPSMIEIAKGKLHRSEIINADITADSYAVEGRYDLITAFRFFLKADPSLRLAAMRALAARLKDRDSRLVFNNHGHLPNLGPARALWRLAQRRSASMTDKEVRALAAAAGLRIERVYGYGQIAGRVAGLLSPRAARSMERLLARLPGVPRLGAYQCYVARLDDPS